MCKSNNNPLKRSPHSTFMIIMSSLLITRWRHAIKKTGRSSVKANDFNKQIRIGCRVGTHESAAIDTVYGGSKLQLFLLGTEQWPDRTTKAPSSCTARIGISSRIDYSAPIESDNAMGFIGVLLVLYFTRMYNNSNNFRTISDNVSVFLSVCIIAVS